MGGGQRNYRAHCLQIGSGSRRTLRVHAAGVQQRRNGAAMTPGQWPVSVQRGGAVEIGLWPQIGRFSKIGLPPGRANFRNLVENWPANWRANFAGQFFGPIFRWAVCIQKSRIP